MWWIIVFYAFHLNVIWKDPLMIHTYMLSLKLLLPLHSYSGQRFRASNNGWSWGGWKLEHSMTEHSRWGKQTETQRIYAKLVLGYGEKIVVPAPQKLPKHAEKLSKASSTQIPLCLKHFCPKKLLSPLSTNSCPKMCTCRIDPSDVCKWHTYFVRMIKTNSKNLTVPFFL